VNTFFANLELLTGLCKPYELAKQMGIDLTNPDLERVPSFTLGVVDTSPLEMAEAYATFAARGEHCDARAVTSIEDAEGNLLKEYGSQCNQVMSNAVADTVNDILKGVLAPGGFGEAISMSQEDAGKTGTTQSARAVWFVGHTPNLATAAMVAGANSFGQPIGLEGLIVGGETIYSASGSGTAGPMWGEAMGIVEQYLEDAFFTPPDLSALGGATTTVPSTGGLSVESARRVLEDAGFNVLVGPPVNSEYPEGTVAYSDPGSGTGAPRGTAISIYPSTGFVPAPPPPPGGGGNGGGNGGGGGNDGGHSGGGGGNDGPGGGGDGGGRGGGGGDRD
jgi:membrane peptidoglycan carboxypeptidase